MYYEDSDTIRNHATGYWFSNGSMRGHGTHTHATAYSADGVLFFLPYSNAYPEGRRYGVVCFRKVGSSFNHVYRSDLAQPNLRTMLAAVKLAQELAQ